MKFFDIGCCDFEGGGNLGVQDPVSRFDLFGRGQKVRGADVRLELLMLPQGFGVAVGPQGAQDGRHHLQHGADVFLGA
jgi:hypothetical protein